MKRTLWFLFLICSGIVAGSLIADLTVGISWLSWLSYALAFGLTSPFVLDLGVITLTLGLSVNLSVGVIIFVALALFIGVKVKF
jgi:hypothetical protein